MERHETKTSHFHLRYKFEEKLGYHQKALPKRNYIKMNTEGANTLHSMPSHLLTYKYSVEANV